MENTKYGAILRNGREIFRLRDRLPLRTPYSVQIDPSNICPFKCSFCPTGNPEILKKVKRPSGTMSMDLFEKLIDDLKQFPEKIPVVMLFCDGEPLMNKSFLDMVAYVKKANVADRLEMTTNAFLLSDSIAQGLIELAIDGMRVSIYGLDNDEYAEKTGIINGFETVFANLLNLKRIKDKRKSSLHVFCKIIDTEEEGYLDRYKEIFKSVGDTLGYDVRKNSWGGGAYKGYDFGNVPYGIKGEKRLVCPDPFARLTVKYNGDVTVCCVDWAHENSVGNASNESLFDIWNGDKLRLFRLSHARGNLVGHCKHCEYLNGYPDYSYLDDFTDELERIYTAEQNQND